MGSMQRQHQQKLNCRFVVAGGARGPGGGSSGATAAAAAAPLGSGDRDRPLVFAFGPPAATSHAWRARRGGAPLLFGSLSLSVSGGRPHNNAAAATPLFSLAMARGRGGLLSESDTAGSSAEAGSPSDSGASSDTTDSLSEGELEFLQRVNCGTCGKALLPKRRGRPSLRPQKPVPEDYSVCDGCRRCFHDRCLEAKGLPLEGQSGSKDRDEWFHDPDCRLVTEALTQQVAKGEGPLPGGRSWQLIALPSRAAAAAGEGRGQKGQEAAKAALKAQINALVEVLAPEYGPGVADHLLDSAGYALLLRGGEKKEPLSAATLEVYGTDLATLDLFSTAFAERGRGHGTALLTAAEQFLGARARVKRLVAVTSADEREAAGVMQRKFGFSRLNGRQTRLVCADFPPLQYYERSVLLQKDLTSGARAAALKAKRGRPRKQPAEPQQQQQQQQEGKEKDNGKDQAPQQGGAADGEKAKGWFPWW